MMWKNYVHAPARALHRTFLMKYVMQSPILNPAKDFDFPRSISSIYCFLLQLSGKVYNLLIEMGMRRARSRQQYIA